MAELDACLTQREWESWVAYYRRFPFDDLHRYHRPAALIVAAHNGRSTQDALDYLHPEPVPDGMTLADFNTLKAFGVDPNNVG